MSNAKLRRKVSQKINKGKYIKHDACNAILQQIGCAWPQAILTSCTCAWPHHFHVYTTVLNVTTCYVHICSCVPAGPWSLLSGQTASSSHAIGCTSPYAGRPKFQHPFDEHLSNAHQAPYNISSLQDLQINILNFLLLWIRWTQIMAHQKPLCKSWLSSCHHHQHMRRQFTI